MRVPSEIAALAIILGIAALCGLTVDAMSSTPRLAAPTPMPTAVSPAALPAFVSGPLDGQRTPRALAQRRPIAVILDNFTGARPQSGIASASLTFETLTESGITRLMSLYLEKDASSVGPIRSLRPYFLDLAAGYRAILVHAGGSPASLAEVKTSPDIGNVDALRPFPQFHRLTSRLDPHNLYSSTAGIRDVARQEGLDIPLPFNPVPHAPSVSGTTAPVRTITVTFGTPQIPALPAYTVVYRYRSASERYERFVGGAPATDAVTNTPVEAANVVVMQTDIKPVPGDTAGRVSIRVMGTGPVSVFELGRMVQGTWQKRAPGAPLRFLDVNGHPIALHPGPTWVEIVAPNNLGTRK